MIRRVGKLSTKKWGKTTIAHLRDVEMGHV